MSLGETTMFRTLFLGLIFHILTIQIFSLVSSQITKTSFSCDGRVSGYYADVGTGCQVYHMCDGLGRKFSFACPNATLFQQRMLICDHWFMVNCSKSESEYSANLLIGQRGKPFVDDSGQSSFQRTPRPDYASGDAEKNSAIFHNKVDPSEDFIGANSGENQGRYNFPSRWSTEYTKVDPTADPKDQISRRQDLDNRNRLNNNFEGDLAQTTTSRTLGGDSSQTNGVVVNFESRFKATTPVYPTFVDDALKLNDLDLVPPKTSPGNTNNQNEGVQVNFESRFKATTPVYPTFVDDSLKLNDLDLTPPKLNTENVEDSTSPNVENRFNSSNEKVQVNFASNFKATTPVYPTFVEDVFKINNLELLPPNSNQDQKEVKVNFVSNFEATTPVYPLSVEATSPIPDEIGLVPPFAPFVQQPQQPETITRISVNFDSNFLATQPNYPNSVEATSPLPEDVGLLPPRNEPTARFLNHNPRDEFGDSKEVEEPSQYYEPPLFGTGYVDPNGALVRHNPNSKHVIAPGVDDWGALRRRFSVPDYEFPLDSGAQRGSYDSELNSFQPRAAGLQKR